MLHFDQQVLVIGHEAICVDVERKSRFLNCEDINKAKIISFGAKDLATIVTRER